MTHSLSGLGPLSPCSSFSPIHSICIIDPDLIYLELRGCTASHGEPSRRRREELNQQLLCVAFERGDLWRFRRRRRSQDEGYANEYGRFSYAANILPRKCIKRQAGRQKARTNLHPWLYVFCSVLSCPSTQATSQKTKTTISWCVVPLLLLVLPCS